MDAFELLKADHKKVAELFDRLDAASGKTKLSVFRQIKSELDVHTHIEEKIFYPALEKPDETHDLTLEAYEEHKTVKTLLRELDRAKTANDEWQAKAKVLRENVEHHVDEEENELFEKADDALSEDEIEALGRRMEAEKARQQGRPASRTSTEKPAKKKKGIVSRIADLVGLGSNSSARKSPPSKQARSERKSASKSAKKSASKKGGSSAKRSKSAASKTTKTSAAKKSGGKNARRR